MSLVAKPLGVRSMRQILTEELARRRQEIIDQMEMKDEDEGHDMYIENEDDTSADGDSCSEQSASSSEWEDDYGRRKKRRKQRILPTWRDIIDDREWWEKTLGTEDPEEFDEAVESYMGEGWEWNRGVEVQYDYDGSSTDDGYSTDGHADFWMKKRVTTKREATKAEMDETDDGHSTEGDADFWVKKRATTKWEATKAEMDEYIQALTQSEEESEVDNML